MRHIIWGYRLISWRGYTHQWWPFPASCTFGRSDDAPIGDISTDCRFRTLGMHLAESRQIIVTYRSLCHDHAWWNGMLEWNGLRIIGRQYPLSALFIRASHFQSHLVWAPKTTLYRAHPLISIQFVRITCQVPMETEAIYKAVKDRYSSASRSKDSAYGHSVAKSFGYSEEELASIPQDANLGLSCGNPVALASLREVPTLILLQSPACRSRPRLTIRDRERR